MMRLADPWVLWLLLLIPLLWWQPRRWRSSPIAFGAAWWARAAGVSLRQRCLFLVPLLRTLGFALLVLAAARPQWGTGEVRTQVQGVAIMGAIDRSSSMLMQMPTPLGQRARFDVAQEMFKAFVLGDGTEQLPGRPHDLIGLVSFARYAETTSPLVRDHETVAMLADAVGPATPRSAEDGTAIGDALALAAARLDRVERDMIERERIAASQKPSDEAADPEHADSADYQIKSKCIILLTDGDETSGELPALQGAELCARLNIRVYVIAIGSHVTYRLPGGQIIQERAANFNQEIPRAIAERTGGKYWSADDAEALRRVYAEIDDLERSEIRVLEYTSYEERFVLPAAFALGALLAELLLSRTLLRKEA